jgi:hypothetical protein
MTKIALIIFCLSGLLFSAAELGNHIHRKRSKP